MFFRQTRLCMHVHTFRTCRTVRVRKTLSTCTNGVFGTIAVRTTGTKQM